MGIIGYSLIGSDNDSFMLDGKENLSALTCSTCGFLLNFDYYNPFFKIKMKTFDYSHCNDLGDIASLRFKEFCIRENYQSVEFKEFDLEPNFFQIVFNDVLEFDSSKSQTEFKNKCKVCGQYEEVFGFEPFLLKGIESELKDGFYRTSQLFGYGNKKNPKIIVAPTTRDKLKKEKIRGVYFEPIII